MTAVLKEDIVICVPTYRRPVALERCLRSLARLTSVRPTRIIVADNDPDRGQGIAVCERLAAEGFPIPITTLGVPYRGIAPARNALVAEAIAAGAIDLIAMIDDDEWAEPEWLLELLTVRRLYDADIVGGPVRRVFEKPIPAYVAHAHDRDYAKLRTGLIELVEATGNILFKASLFRETAPPWFDLQFALMGNEDKDLLMRYKRDGKRFAWADTAVVTEEYSASRCSARWALQRAYRTGNLDIILSLKHRPPGFNLLTESVKIVGALSVATINLIALGWLPGRRFEGLRLASRVAGKLTALLGSRYEEYTITHGG